MSESDSELLTTNNIFTLQTDSTIVSTRGPNINLSNLKGMSFRNGCLTSTMQVPRNLEWQRHTESNLDVRSFGYRRGTSPMSIASACDVRQRNFNNSYLARRMNSHRSVYNGRDVSPVSMRSIDSNATVSAADIAKAFNDIQFNRNEMRIIKQAYKKLMKQEKFTHRRHLEKRRNHRLFSKRYQRKSGYDSGELASDSSVSSAENRSTKTNNMTSSTSTKTDILKFRRILKESNMFKDCTDDFRQNRIHSVVGRPTKLNSSSVSVSSFRSLAENPRNLISAPTNFNNTHRHQSVTQSDRFRNRFLLPSQRFSRSITAWSIPEAAQEPHTENNIKPAQPTNRDNIAKESFRDLNSDEEIFSEMTAIEKPTKKQRKSSTDSDDIILPPSKKPKLDSLCKNMTKASEQSAIGKSVSADFDFVKPAFPVRNSAYSKAKEKLISKSANMNTEEMLISKSVTPLSDTIIQTHLSSKQICSILQPQTVENKDVEIEDIAEKSAVCQDTADLSMRPSFIKRKLFTQKMDVTENKNTDNSAANSPQNSIYGNIQKDKNKARKLVTSQYCLSRDIQKDESNLLDLIHKIVPAETMNATNQTNKTVLHYNKPEESVDKWDVMSIISTCNNDEDVSDTFTDDESVLAVGKQQTNTKSPLKPKGVIEKNGPGTSKKTVQKYVKSFWDIEFDSDIENVVSSKSVVNIPSQKEESMTEILTETNIVVAPKPKCKGFSSMFQSNRQPRLGSNVSLLNTTTESVAKLNNTNRNFKLYSHRNTEAKIKVYSENKDDKKPNFEEKINNKAKDPEKSKPKVNKSPPKNKKTNKENHREIPNKDKKQSNKMDRSSTKGDEQTKPQTKERTDIRSEQQKYACQNKNKTCSSNQQHDIKVNNQRNKNESKNSINILGDTKSNTPVIQNRSKTRASNQQQNGKANDHKNKKESQNTMKVLGDTKSINKAVTQPKKTNTNYKTSVSKKVKEINACIIAPDPSNNTKKTQNATVNTTNSSKLNSFEEHLNETNNNLSTRPVRSCRLSKQNVSLDMSKANETHCRSLRSRDVSLTSFNNQSLKTKPTRNKKTKLTINDQSALSESSFSSVQNKITKKKTLSTLLSRLGTTKEVDSSDVSFSLTHDRSVMTHLSKRNPVKAKTVSTGVDKQVKIILTPMKHLRDNSSKNDIRPVRKRLANRRYVW